jgi:hypothetical protein
MWYVVWYSSYSPNEKHFISSAVLLGEVILTLYPSNSQPLVIERLLLSIVTTLIHQQKFLSLQILKSLIKVVPINKEFVENLAGAIEQM